MAAHRDTVRWACPPHGESRRSRPITTPEYEPTFTATVCPAFEGPVLECAGDLDLGTVPLLDAALHRALASCPAPPLLVVDLAAVTFMDSSGLNALLRARLLAAGAGAEVRLVRPPRQVARLLEMTGADRVFAVDPDVPTEAAPGPAGR
ncbi:STAS domain-containing protein [Kitasatospora sp. NPDC058201]|uniref:STAS domain-containing protein n=1 Tax=unclassified Kitasatospora TaxID=2633591 RepID=UPI00365DC7DD